MSVLPTHHWYVVNSDLDRDLGIEMVKDMIATFASSHEKRLQNHTKFQASRLLNVSNISRRRKQEKLFEIDVKILIDSMELS
jgi:hypothetical protein